MRTCLLVISLVLLACFSGGRGTRTKVVPAVFSAARSESKEVPKVDFNSEIKPIFVHRCQPCHFSGGVMYARLPFDRPETIKMLGRKLFTRIKDEKEQDLILKFLSQE
jgi:hypothetical protein